MKLIKTALKYAINIFYFSFLLICILLYFLGTNELFFSCFKLLLFFRSLFIVYSILQDIRPILQKNTFDTYVIWKLIYKLLCFISLFLIYYLIDSAMYLDYK